MNAQVQRLKDGLQQAGLWPQPGEVAPPNGASPQQLRRSIRDFITDMDGEILYTAYQAMLFMWLMRASFAASPADYEEGPAVQARGASPGKGYLAPGGEGRARQCHTEIRRSGES